MMLQETQADKKKDKELRAMAVKLGCKMISTPAIPPKTASLEERLCSLAAGWGSATSPRNQVGKLCQAER